MLRLQVNQSPVQQAAGRMYAYIGNADSAAYSHQQSTNQASILKAHAAAETVAGSENSTLPYPMAQDYLRFFHKRPVSGT